MGFFDELGKMAVQIGKEAGKSVLNKAGEIKAYNDNFDEKSENELRSIYISAKRSKNYTVSGCAKSALRRNYNYTDWDLDLLDDEY
ncbi:hypothetical protein [Fusobacterium russii]|uniref:hypothetical protein n=1 Tax=Fusobacterium russii TaxID=854 RepID=UPI0003AA5BEC|nr:hypothetical protein [Fusobacterium russii]